MILLAACCLSFVFFFLAMRAAIVAMLAALTSSLVNGKSAFARLFFCGTLKFFADKFGDCTDTTTGLVLGYNCTEIAIGAKCDPMVAAFCKQTCDACFLGCLD